MGMMSGALAEAPGRNRAGVAEREELFSTALVVSAPRQRGRSYSLPASIAGHVLAIAMLVAIPFFWPESPPDHPDYIRALIYNPPPRRRRRSRRGAGSSRRWSPPSR